MRSYFEERTISTLERIRKITDNLPYYVEEFFVGIENRTTPLTRLNYAYDLRIFFDFLSRKVFRGKKDALDISIEDLDKLAADVFTLSNPVAVVVDKSSIF